MLNESRGHEEDAYLTQEDFASRLGVSKHSVSLWETGKILPKIRKLEIIADFFGIKLSTLAAGAFVSPFVDAPWVGEPHEPGFSFTKSAVGISCNPVPQRVIWGNFLEGLP